MRARHALILLATATGACDELPGDPIGRFLVEGVVETHECPEAIPVAADSLRFEVMLRGDDTTVWWQAEGRPLLAGRRLDEGSFAFAFTRSLQATAPTPGAPPCRLVERETLDVTTDPGAGPRGTDRLEGLQRIEYTPGDAAACAFLRADQGGPFRALPCAIEVALEGESLDPPPDAGAPAPDAGPQG